MTDSELLDRRIEALVVSTVHRELRRIEDQAQKQRAEGQRADKQANPAKFASHVGEHLADAFTYAATASIGGMGGGCRGLAPWDVTKANDGVLEAVVNKANDGETVDGLTVAVLLESLRRANKRAGEYALELSNLGVEHATLKSRHATQSNTLQRKVKRQNELIDTCIRLTQERDAAQRDYASAMSEADKLRAAYLEATKP